MCYPGETEENHENLYQVSRFQGRDLNPGPPEYETGVLTTRSKCSINKNCEQDLTNVFRGFARSLQ
jgi:hypothetical protein